MKRPLLLQLLLPLSVATALAILVHLYWPADGFFLNIAAGFVGSIVTVGYIDWILKRHEERRWDEADARIKSRLRKLATATITGIRTSFGYGTEIFDRRAVESGDVESMRLEVVRIASHVLSPGAEAKVAALNQNQWKSLVSHLQLMSSECGLILERFGSRLPPKTMVTLLDLQQNLEAAQTFWRVFPDIAGMPVDQLPQTKTPSEELQAAWCEITARDIQNTLKNATALAAP